MLDDEEIDLRPTMEMTSDANSESIDLSLDVSKKRVDVVAGTHAKFADETACLLRVRLQGFTLVTTIVLVLVLVSSVMTHDRTLVGLRICIALLFAAAVWVLRSDWKLSLKQLRAIELGSVMVMTTQILLMGWVRVTGFANEGDVPSTVASHFFQTNVWCITILAYGIFIPNHWKRALLLMLPIASMPYLVDEVLRWYVPEVRHAMTMNNMISPIPLPFVALLVSVFGTHLINTVRREAYKARQYGQYRLKDKLGEGGMGEVYKAEHRMLKRPCAIKLIRSESEADEKAICRFEEEVQATARLSHWNTVDVFDYGRTDDGTFYYVMELLPGASLAEIVSRFGLLPPERTIHFLAQTCDALQEAHDLGLVHRDIKPANIFAALRGGVYDVAKLLDFGLVRGRSDQDTSNVSGRTGSRGFGGSPLYIAPEQVSDFDSADARSDLYSLGAVGYELLTARPPFTGKSIRELLTSHATQAVDLPSQVVDTIPTDLERVILRCLEKSPEKRFESAASLKQALLECECAGQWTSKDAHDWWHGRGQFY